MFTYVAVMEGGNPDNVELMGKYLCYLEGTKKRVMLSVTRSHSFRVKVHHSQQEPLHEIDDERASNSENEQGGTTYLDSIRFCCNHK